MDWSQLALELQVSLRELLEHLEHERWEVGADAAASHARAAVELVAWIEDRRLKARAGPGESA